MENLSWISVTTRYADPKQADTFCSPACGAGCTVRQYQEAVRNAHALAKNIGPDWVPDVWENLGWHFKAVSPCGRIKVHQHLKSYTAFLSEAGNSGGRYTGQGSTPKKAIRKAVKQGRKALDELATLMQGL